MSFDNNKFLIIRNTVHPEVCNLLVNYLNTKETAALFLFDKEYLHDDTVEWGRWDDPQAYGAFSIYGDMAMETLLQQCKPIFEKFLNKDLMPNYSYTRIYTIGNELKKHYDRDSCEISATINLGGDLWPIYLNSGGKDIKVVLNPGDSLVYRGAEVLHWRERFSGSTCYQVFLHYNEIKEGKTISPRYDGRPHLGVPPIFRQK